MKNDEICWFVHRYILVYQSALLFHSPSTYVRLHPECCPNASWGPELSTYIDQKNKPNVGNYSIHEAFGLLRFFVFPLIFSWAVGTIQEWFPQVIHHGHIEVRNHVSHLALKLLAKKVLVENPQWWTTGTSKINLNGCWTENRGNTPQNGWWK